MSIIPVICHNYLHNSLKRNSCNVSTNISKKNIKDNFSDKVISVEEFINMFDKAIGLRNNTRGGSRL